MEASINGQTATVELLLGAGADKEAKNEVRERKREYHSTHFGLARRPHRNCGAAVGSGG